LHSQVLTYSDVRKNTIELEFRKPGIAPRHSRARDIAHAQRRNHDMVYQTSILGIPFHMELSEVDA
jgi:hypothetical protein